MRRVGGMYRAERWASVHIQRERGRDGRIKRGVTPLHVGMKYWKECELILTWNNL